MEQDIAVIEQKYNVRKLGAKDIFAFSRIISKIGLANFKRCFKGEEFQKLMKQVKEGGKNEGNVEAVGALATLELADVFFENLPNCEREMFSFLADLLGMKVAEVEVIPPADFLDIIIEIFKKPEFNDFFKAALRLLK